MCPINQATPYVQAPNPTVLVHSTHGAATLLLLVLYLLSCHSAFPDAAPSQDCPSLFPSTPQKHSQAPSPTSPLLPKGFLLIQKQA